MRKVLLCCCAVLFCLFRSAFAQDDRPNILLIIADDLGYTDIGAFGSEIPTPELDALAFAGVRLTNFHTGQACQQTRMMLMSGRGFASAIQMNPPLASGERANELRQDIATIPELLRDAGYRTYMSGKWDLGLGEPAWPVARGFDRSFSLLQAAASHFAEPFWDDTSYYVEDTRHVELDDLPDDFYTTRSYTDKMLQFLREHDSAAPWFGYLTYTSPHWPLQVPDEWLDRFAGHYDAGYDALRAQRTRGAAERGVLPPGADVEAFAPTAPAWSSLAPGVQARYARAQEIYASMIAFMDQQIGRLVAFLEETGQLDNTVIFFMSDHGASSANIGIETGRSNMPERFDELAARHDNSLANIGRPGSFVDHGVGFAEAATAPLTYYKGTLSEGGIRAAAFVRYPAALQGGSVDNTFVTVMDLMPTFLEIAGTSHPGAVSYNRRRIQPIIGRSFWSALRGEAETVHGEGDSAGWVAGSTGAIIEGRYKLTNQPRPGSAADPEQLRWRLYDLSTDPGELTDIAAMHPDIVESLLDEWQQNWR